MAAGWVTALSIDPRVMQQLQGLYQQQESEGKLPSKQQLQQYYATFRNKFGPEQLARLDGEALLETMHSHDYILTSLTIFITLTMPAFI